MFFKGIAGFPKISESEKEKKILSYDDRSERVSKLDQKIHTMKIEFDEKLKKQLQIKANDIFSKFSNDKSIYVKLSGLKTRKRCYNTLLDEMRKNFERKVYKRERVELSNFISLEINRYKESIANIEAIKETIVSSISRKEVSNPFSEDDNYTKVSSILLHWNRGEVKLVRIIKHFFKSKAPLVEFEINNYAKNNFNINSPENTIEILKFHMPMEKLIDDTNFKEILAEAYKNSSDKDKALVKYYLESKGKDTSFINLK